MGKYYNEIGIYIIKNSINNLVYIGQSINIEARKQQHFYLLKRNIHYIQELQNLYNKYGKEIFSFSILEKCTKNKLDDKEKKYIALYDSYEHGYNRTRGGQPNVFFYRKKEKHCLICDTITQNKKYCLEHTNKCPICNARQKENGLCKKCKTAIMTKNCMVCNKEIIKQTNNQKYCTECQKQVRREKQKNLMRNRRNVTH